MQRDWSYQNPNREKLLEEFKQVLMKGSADEVREWLESGAPVNQRFSVARISCIAGMACPEDEMTPLMILSERQGGKRLPTQLIRDVIETYGAQVHATSSFHNTAILLAAENGNAEAVRALLEKGAFNKDLASCFLVLPRAASSGNLEVVKMLVAEGADPTQVNPAGWSVLHHAVRSRNMGVVKYLIGKGADVHGKTHDGITVLHEAIIVENEEVVKLLVEKGANVNARRTEDGETILHRAMQYGSPELVEMLMKHGADTTVTDKKGETPENTFRNHYYYRDRFREMLDALAGRPLQPRPPKAPVPEPPAEKIEPVEESRPQRVESAAHMLKKIRRGPSEPLTLTYTGNTYTGSFSDPRPTCAPERN